VNHQDEELSMRQPGWVRGYRVAFALLTFATVAYQFADRAGKGDFSPANFFSFFTIESNLFAAAVLLVAGLRADAEGEGSLAWDLVRGAATVYMATTGVVYGLLLSGYTDALQTPVPWVNNVLHRVMPLVLVTDWLLRPPAHRIPVRRALIWIAYPLAYLTYSLARGPRVGWYPYPFLDPAKVGGYPGVAAYGVTIAAGFLLFSWLVVGLGRRVRLRLEPAT
jgi:hypothetical protein